MAEGEPADSSSATVSSADGESEHPGPGASPWPEMSEVLSPHGGFSDSGEDHDLEDDFYQDFLDEEQGLPPYDPFYDPFFDLDSDFEEGRVRCCPDCNGFCHQREDSASSSEREDEDAGYESDGYKSVCEDESASFPQFNRLPPELRCRIWEMYCPELVMRSRLLDFEIGGKPPSRPTLHPPVDPSDYVVYQGPSLKASTRRIRKVLAVHRESHALVTGVLPDTLAFRWASSQPTLGPRRATALGTGVTLGTGVVRFHKEHDIVLFAGLPFWSERWENQSTQMSLEGFADKIQNVAFFARRRLGFEETQDCRMTLDNLPHLKNVFYCNSCDTHTIDDMRWLAQPSCLERTVWRVDEYMGIFTPELYCWPDPAKSSEWRVPRRVARVVQLLAPHAAEAGWKLLPMLYFEGKEDMAMRDEIVNHARVTQARAQEAPVAKENDSLDEHDESDSDSGDDSDSDYSDFADGPVGMIPVPEFLGNDALLEYMLFGPLGGPGLDDFPPF
ncbi:hypothetical protein ACO1O0_006896 [Amphichorda felina]